MSVLDSLRNLFRRKAATAMVPTTGTGGWFPVIREPFAGAWQRNLDVKPALAAQYFADFACRALIAHDISKLGVKLMQRSENDIWTEVENPAYSPVLREPNHYQTAPQFWESWIDSKLSRGNTYVLKGRDNRRVVNALYVLDPQRVTPLIAIDKSVFYQLATDDLNITESQVIVPATEIIHDRFNCAHWLVGRPPIYAGALAAIQGLNIQTQSARLFQNNATPSGIVTAPGNISDDEAARFKTDWEQKFTGENHGRVAILGGGVKFEKVTMTAVEGQLIEQLNWTAKSVCTTYHVPAWKIGVGERPPYNSAQQANEDYYSTCIQTLIEQAEACLDKGLGIGKQYGLRTEFDIDNLLRMDASAQAEFITKLVSGGVMTPNEGRAYFNLKKLTGGDTVYMQEQDIPMSVAASRTTHPSEAKAQEAATAAAAATKPPADDDGPGEEPDDDTKSLIGLHAGKGLADLMAEDLMQ